MLYYEHNLIFFLSAKRLKTRYFFYIMILKNLRASLPISFARNSIWKIPLRILSIQTIDNYRDFLFSSDLIRLKIDRYSRLCYVITTAIDIFPVHHTILLSMRIYVFFFCGKTIYSFSSKAVDEFIVMKTVQQSKSRSCCNAFRYSRVKFTCVRKIFFNYLHIYSHDAKERGFRFFHTNARALV